MSSFRNKNSTRLGKSSCIKCSSSDGMENYHNVFEDGTETQTGYCFVCHTYFPDTKVHTLTHRIDSGGYNESKKKYFDWITNDLNSAALGRGIKASTSSRYEVKVEYSQDTREPLSHYYPLTKEGKIIGYKERSLPKKFSAWGNVGGCELFGQKLAAPGGRFLIICEGELDTLSAYQMIADRGKNYKVVGLAMGANTNQVKANLEYVSSFESVALVFDQDAPGQKAAKEVAALLPPGKAKIVSFSENDVNDMLIAGKQQEFWTALMSGKEFRPDGIIRLSQAWDSMWKDENVESILYPWNGLNTKLYGMRPRELVTVTSGSGMGKTALIREVMWHLFNATDDNIGVLALEENIGKTAWGMVSMAARLPLSIREERQGVAPEDIQRWWDGSIGTGRFIAYDHFGSTNSDNLLNQVRYLIQGMDCKWIVLDHLSIVVSSMEGSGGDERRTIDDIMTRLRTLVEETGAGLILVSHLRRAAGDKGHERGAEVSLSQLRGSHAIVQLSDAVIGLERNQQEEDEKLSNLTKVVVLKNRYAGFTGMATHLFYDKKTGRLYEIEDVEGWQLGQIEPNELVY